MYHRPPVPFPHLPTASPRRSSLRPVPRATCLLPLFCPASVSPPLAALVLCPGPCRSLGGRLPLVPPSPLCPRLYPSPCELFSLVMFWCLVVFPSGGLFRVRREQARAPPLPDSLSPKSSPSPNKWPCRRRSGYPATPPHPPYPYVVLIPSPRLKFVGRSASRMQI